MTDAHSEIQHLALQYSYPAHEPRESDPHYKAFNAARKRLKAAGKLVCWIGNADCSSGPIQLHHSTVEFSLSNIVDVKHFAELYPEFHVTDDESFFTWVEQEGNLLPLCALHHTGILGIHVIHYPAWIAQRFMKAGAIAPEQKVPNTGKAN